MRRTGTTRRSALTATGALALGAVLTGCGSDEDSGGQRGDASADARAAAARTQTALRAAAARTSSALLARYDEVVTAHPVTAAGLAPLRSAVQEHTSALGGPPKGTAQPSPTVRATGAKAALQALAAEERRVADAHTRTLLKAGPELARLLASVAAAGAAHAYLLTELAKESSS
ncbi:hypothetical protein ACFW9O_28495 [Streptomyces sp. NPDC059499]|uniref:hypothetical protein n=1 Tax=Streptomyces sp. NPDC059499 TaxID=3346852 RepID=UPI0036C8CDE7